MPWSYVRGGVRKGPFDDAAFRQMGAAGELEPTDLVWSPGMPKWVRAETVPGLLAPPPPPPKRQPTPAELFLEDHSARVIQATGPIPKLAGPDQPQVLPRTQAEPGATARAEGGNTSGVASPLRRAKKAEVGWYFEALRKYAVFSGRARRREFWGFLVVSFLISFFLILIDWIAVNYSGMPIKTGLLFQFYAAAILFPSLAVTVRRLHDVGKPGWFLWFSPGAIWPLGFVLYVYLNRQTRADFLAPLFIFLGTVVFGYFFLLMVWDSQPGVNRYGPNPKGINAA
jgi:uncharacterized membrane protein YhaH (DUF805 family)